MTEETKSTVKKGGRPRKLIDPARFDQLYQKTVELHARLEKLEKANAAHETVLTTMTEALVALSREVKERTISSVASIHKVEAYSGESAPAQRRDTLREMSLENKLQSIRNACAILPPNLKVNGQHTLANVSAICGFQVSPAQLELAYKGVQQ